jgi:glycyl-tRNA synthetase beta chain
VGVTRRDRGLPAAQALAAVIPPLVESMTFPKMMRWGTGEHRFVRPVHSIVAMLDDAVVDMTIAGVRSGAHTFGHRFAGGSRIALGHPSAYLRLLRENGVLADISERRSAIEGQIAEAAAAVGGRVAPPPGAGGAEGDPGLLDEVTQLVEWPAVISGQFEPVFLDLPAEILVTAMRHHQKYFSLLDRAGGISNRFLAVANLKADLRGAVRKGNEWVLRARLADARFFWDDDRKTPLTARTPSLERVTFHEKLGSYSAKTERLGRLVPHLAQAFVASGHHPETEAATGAAALCKNDLTTQMVKEFPELEGIVGGLYARADGLPEPVWAAIYGHYLPRAADDPLPSCPEGAILSLADRLDTQAGIFLLGIVPTGSRDPYALRRSVQGACRILIEMKVHLSLSRLLTLAIEAYGGGPQGAVPPAEALASLLDFYRGRQQFLGEEAGLRGDSLRAALAPSADDPHDARLRSAALDEARSEAGFENLAVAHKRIKNILVRRPEGRLDVAALRENAEKTLGERLAAARPLIEQARLKRDYRAALQEIGRLRDPLDRFFSEVMVMTEDRAVRENRLRLLGSMADLFMSVGDFSELVPEAEPAAGARRSRV